MSEMSDEKKDQMSYAMKKWGEIEERNRIKIILAKYCLPKQYEKIVNEIGDGVD